VRARRPVSPDADPRDVQDAGHDHAEDQGAEGEDDDRGAATDESEHVQNYQSAEQGCERDDHPLADSVRNGRLEQGLADSVQDHYSREDHRASNQVALTRTEVAPHRERVEAKQL
jgi:hypothetical protein